MQVVKGPMAVIQAVDRMLINLNSLLMDDTDSVQIHSHNISELHKHTEETRAIDTHRHFNQSQARNCAPVFQSCRSNRSFCLKDLTFLRFVGWMWEIETASLS